MYNFGAGALFGTPLQDATGATISNPTPVQFGVLQDVTVDESWETKMLYGAAQFPVAVGRGKGKIALKAKAANFSAELVNTFLYGMPTLTSIYDGVVVDLTGTLIPATPFQITPTVPASGTFVADLGVTSAINGVPFTRVASSPTAGQYAVNTGTGVYTFASADNVSGLKAYISYTYTAATPAAARKIVVINEPMGIMPVFQVDLFTSYLGKTWHMRYPNAIASKFSRTFKNDDFTIPEFDIECFADSSGNISYQGFSE